MVWKKLLLPLLSLAMLVVNGVQLASQLSQPDSGSAAGTVLMTLFWLALLVFSLRFALARPKETNSRDGKKTDR